MATLPRCLCLFLTLWMVSLRTSRAIKAGSSDSSWWGSEASSAFTKAARQFRNAGDFSAAQRIYEQGYEEAKKRQNIPAQERYLSSIAGCRLMQLKYLDALRLYLEARKLAVFISDREELGAIAFNISNLYMQVWDFEAALAAAEEGRRAVATLAKPYYKAQLLLHLGRLHAVLADGGAGTLYSEGIEASREQGDVVFEAQGWDLLGEEWIQNGRYADAERALTEAFRLRVLRARHELPFSYGRLGALKLAQGDLKEAAGFTERAISAAAMGSNAIPEYLLRHQRGRVRLLTGDRQGSLRDFEEALDLAARWRLEVLPALSSLTAANVELERRIFDSFITAGAEEAFRTGSSRWVRETFQAVELNRAASLREGLALTDVWRKKLPPEYWETSAELRAEEARFASAGARSSTLAGLRLKLTEMEAEAGLGSALNKSPNDKSPNKDENFRTPISLIHFQAGLRESELFLSFHLGETESYLWTVTRRKLRLHRLPRGPKLQTETREFRDAVQAGRPDGYTLARRLYTELFGDLGPDEIGTQEWLLSLDDGLFELPFAALVTELKRGQAAYLVERHSLQTVPGALLLTTGSSPGFRKTESGAWLLGVGDPIYNTADPRWKGQGWKEQGWTGPKRAGRILELFAQGGEDQAMAQFGRLVGSGAELDSTVRAWSAEGGTAVLLRGPDARRDEFVKLAAREPAVIHLATHVMMQPSQRGKAFIAFGLGPAGGAEFLTTTDVAMLHAPGSLVIMTGCATGTGEARAGAGLLGLTRAWLMAGASTIVATGWPEKDSTGEIFTNFYRHLRNAPAVEALRRSQVEMIRSGTWRAAPGYWASYQVTGGGR